MVKPGDGAPVWVTGKRARAVGHLLRAENDAILIGRATAVADNPSLTCRLPGLTKASPIRIVMDSRLSLADSADFGADRVLLLQQHDLAPLWVAGGREAGK